jgi:hypothetical protein
MKEEKRGWEGMEGTISRGEKIKNRLKLEERNFILRKAYKTIFPITNKTQMNLLM